MRTKYTLTEKEKQEADDFYRDLNNEKEIEAMEQKQDELVTLAKQALHESNIHTAYEYMVFVGKTIFDYLDIHASKSDYRNDNGVWTPSKYRYTSDMLENMESMWDVLKGMSAGVRGKNAGETIASLAWANHLDHLGGNLLQDHGKLGYDAINGISEEGLDAIFGDSVGELINAIGGK